MAPARQGCGRAKGTGASNDRVGVFLDLRPIKMRTLKEGNAPDPTPSGACGRISAVEAPESARRHHSHEQEA
jgi:hypothetical protein